MWKRQCWSNLIDIWQLTLYYQTIFQLTENIFTETILVKIDNDILKAFEGWKGVLLT